MGLFRQGVSFWSHRLLGFRLSWDRWLDVSIDCVFDDDLFGLFDEDCVLFVYQFFLSFFDGGVLLVDLVSDRGDDGDGNPRDEEGEN